MDQRITQKDAHDLFRRVNEAARTLAVTNGNQRNQSLHSVRDALEAAEAAILAANAKDVARAREAGTRDSLVDRMELTNKRMAAMAEALDTVAALPDPLGKNLSGWTLPNGLRIEKRSVPLGTIGMIYESRPNVTLDAAALALKSGNGIVLRGSSSAYDSNEAIAKAIRQGLANSGLPEDLVCLYPSTHREDTEHLLTARGLVDLIIPRGGAGLIDYVTRNASVPTIETGVGNCHLFVDASADLDKALEILENGKVQRPGVCNALETLLVHQDCAREFLPRVVSRLGDRVELRGCDRTRSFVSMKEATEEDWRMEYLDFILAVRVVDHIDQALEHIRLYGTKHSEAIATETMDHARRFQNEVDAAAVYVNASTRFTDGEMFGFGAEIGISTQKVHARGPMALEELVTHRYLLTGDGQVRS